MVSASRMPRPPNRVGTRCLRQPWLKSSHQSASQGRSRPSCCASSWPIPTAMAPDVPLLSKDGQSWPGSLRGAITEVMPHNTSHTRFKHTSPLIPQVAPMRLTLRGQCCIHHKNVFTSYGSGHKTFPGLYSPWVRGHDSSHDRRQPLPHDKDWLKQTSPWGNGAKIHITRHEDTYLLTLA
jgi:hypothetical protein